MQAGRDIWASRIQGEQRWRRSSEEFASVIPSSYNNLPAGQSWDLYRIEIGHEYLALWSQQNGLKHVPFFDLNSSFQANTDQPLFLEPVSDEGFSCPGRNQVWPWARFLFCVTTTMTMMTITTTMAMTMRTDINRVEGVDVVVSTTPRPLSDCAGKIEYEN